jgi:hypothetical protein
MVREHEEDSSKADSILREALIQYPTSDYLPEALERLGLAGSSADTGYAGVYFSRAEHFVVDEFNLDSARAHYQVVVDRFPDSKYFLQSRFALIWLTEMYDSPGDSSVIRAYNELSDSFPSSDWANEARQRTQYVAKESPSDDDQEADSVMLAEGDDGDTLQAAVGDTSVYIDPEVAALSRDGTLLAELRSDPIRIDEPFIYPEEAYRGGWEGWLIFQVLLDPFGEIEEYELKTKSPNEQINFLAEETFASMAWDPTRIQLELQDQWLYYRFMVQKPDLLK